VAFIGFLRWVVILLELAIGVVITWLGFRSRPLQLPVTPNLAGEK
jgi:hypothetical protein